MIRKGNKIKTLRLLSLLHECITSTYRDHAV